MEAKVEPTSKQKQEFWLWCGFKHPTQEQAPLARYVNEWWLYPDGDILAELHILDLNNLWKYAVPKAKEKYQLLYIYFDAPYGEDEDVDWYCKVSSDTTDVYQQLGTGRDEDPALALFWAIYEALGEFNK